MTDVYLSPSVQKMNFNNSNYGTDSLRMNYLTDVLQYELERNSLHTLRNNPECCLMEVVDDTNSKKPQIYVGLQTENKFKTSKGASIYFNQKDVDAKLANAIFNELKNVTCTKENPIKSVLDIGGNAGYFELGNIKCPAVLIFLGCRNNADDIKNLKNNTYEIAVAIAKGILNYFSLDYLNDNPAQTAKMRMQYNNAF